MKTESTLQVRNIERTVHFIPMRNDYEIKRRHVAMQIVLMHKAYHLVNMFVPGDIVGIKIHTKKADPLKEYVIRMADILRNIDAKPFLCDTSSRFKNRHENGISLSEKIMRNSREFSGNGLPFMALDGIHGEHEISSRNHKSVPKDVFLAGETASMDGLISVAAPSVNSLCGMAGSIVNMGMGLASKKGKIRQRTMSPPVVNVEKCYACRKCLRMCPSQAIYLKDGHVAIDPARCINCGLCTEIAMFGGIVYDWNATEKHFRENTINHALAARRVLKKRVIYVVVLHDLLSSMGGGGILVSSNPVAVDLAALDMYQQAGIISEERYAKANSLLLQAEQAGLGQLNYSINTVAY